MQLRGTTPEGDVVTVEATPSDVEDCPIYPTVGTQLTATWMAEAASRRCTEQPPCGWRPGMHDEAEVRGQQRFQSVQPRGMPVHRQHAEAGVPGRAQAHQRQQAQGHRDDPGESQRSPLASPGQQPRHATAR